MQKVYEVYLQHKTTKATHSDFYPLCDLERLESYAVDNAESANCDVIAIGEDLIPNDIELKEIPRHFEL